MRGYFWLEFKKCLTEKRFLERNEFAPKLTERKKFAPFEAAFFSF